MAEANSVEQPAAPASETSSEPEQSRDLPRRNPVDKSVLTVPGSPLDSRSRPHQAGSRPSLPRVRPTSFRSSSPSVCAKPSSPAQSERRVHRSVVPRSSSRLHRYGDEAAWWDRLGIDVLEFARVLWLELHPLPVTHPGVSENLGLTADQTLTAISVEEQRCTVFRIKTLGRNRTTAQNP